MFNSGSFAICTPTLLEIQFETRAEETDKRQRNDMRIKRSLFQLKLETIYRVQYPANHSVMDCPFARHTLKNKPVSNKERNSE